MKNDPQKFKKSLVHIAVCLLFTAFPAHVQSDSFNGIDYSQAAGTAFSSSLFAQKLRSGVSLYRESRWQQAISELKAAQDEALDNNQLSEALYWLALTELASLDFDAALRDMDTLKKSGGNRVVDIAYHQGRVYYCIGYYEKAIAAFGEYIENADANEHDRISAADYWIGECYFSMGQLDNARKYFKKVIEQYRNSAKYEASVYRISIINQKQIELELMEMLRWSHEETLKSGEEYQRRERMYDQALNTYQKQISELQRDPRLAELEAANSLYRRQLTDAQNRIRSLENQLGLPDSGAFDSPQESSYDLLPWAMQLRRTMYEILLQQPDITILYSMCGRLDQYILGESDISENDLAAMELTVTLIKAQYNLAL